MDSIILVIVTYLEYLSCFAFTFCENSGDWDNKNENFYSNGNRIYNW